MAAAIDEFAAHGFEGASTRRIAEASGAYQSQIKYHFDTKAGLWKRCLERLLEELDDAIADAASQDDGSPIALVESAIRGLVHFAAARPELSRIMMQEATNPSDRLTWLVESYTSQRQARLAQAWTELQNREVAAPLNHAMLYHTILGAASLLYANAPEAQLMGIDPTDPNAVKSHADGLVALFLPGLSRP